MIKFGIMKHRGFFFGLLILGLSVSACAPEQSAKNQLTQDSQPIATDIPGPLSIWLPPYLPDRLSRDLILPKGMILASGDENASIRIDVGSDALVSQWIYALVAPFPTVTDEISFFDLKTFWKGGEVKSFPAEKLLVDGKTKALFEKLWGIASVSHVTVTAGEELLATAWDAKTNWAIIPFESLEPRWKVIRVDGQSPVNKGFDLFKYPLTMPLSAVGEASDVSRFLGVNISSVAPL